MTTSILKLILSCCFVVTLLYQHLMIKQQFRPNAVCFFAGWRYYAWSPIVIMFVLPLLLIVYLYLSALLLFVYRRRKPILDAFHHRNIWEGYRRTMAVLWSGHGWIWHGIFTIITFHSCKYIMMNDGTFLTH